MNHRRDLTMPEYVLGLTSLKVDLVVFDILGAVVERTSIKTDDLPLAVQLSSEAAPKPAADPGDEDVAFREPLSAARRSVRGTPPVLPAVVASPPVSDPIAHRIWRVVCSAPARIGGVVARIRPLGCASGRF